MPYTAPTPADLRTRYPAFATVADATIQFWLTDAQRFVDTSWSEPDYAPALAARAAHSMAEAGVAGLAGSEITGMAAAGVTDFKSGAFSASLSADAVRKAVTGGLAGTRYGQEYLDLLQRNKGGPLVTGGGVVIGNAGFSGWAGALPSWQV